MRGVWGGVGEVGFGVGEVEFGVGEVGEWSGGLAVMWE